jgi:hypothetical protein
MSLCRLFVHVRFRYQPSIELDLDLTNVLLTSHIWISLNVTEGSHRPHSLHFDDLFYSETIWLSDYKLVAS